MNGWGLLQPIPGWHSICSVPISAHPHNYRPALSSMSYRDRALKLFCKIIRGLSKPT
jgi:hypothetical protein